MSTPVQLSRVLQLAPEGSLGAGGTPKWRLQSFDGMFDPNERFATYRSAGNQYPTSGSLSPLGAVGTPTMQPDYEELLLPFAGLFGRPTFGLTAGAQIAHDSTWDLVSQVMDTPVSYVIQEGDAVQANQVDGALFTGMTFRGSRQAVSGTTAIMAQKLDAEASLTAIVANDDVQTITMAGSGGTFKATFRGAQTGALANNVSLAGLKAALEGLATVGAGNTLVTGTPGATYRIEFDGALGNQLVPLIVLDTSLLTGGLATIAHTTPGVSATLGGATQPIQGAEINVYLDTSAGGLGNSQELEAFEFTLTVADKWQGTYPLNRANASFKDVTPRVPRFELALTAAQDAQGRSLLNSLRLHQQVYVRIDCLGPAIETGKFFALQLDLALKVTAPGRGREVNGLYARDFTATLFADPSWGKSAHILLRNTQAAL